MVCKLYFKEKEQVELSKANIEWLLNPSENIKNSFRSRKKHFLQLLNYFKLITLKLSLCCIFHHLHTK